MTGFELPWVHRVVDRFGKVRFYFRRKGHARCPLPGESLGPEFMAAYHAAVERGPLPLQGPQSAAVAGSIGWLVERYYRSAEFQRLAASTRKTYRRILESLREEHGHRLVKHLQRKHIIGLRHAKETTPAAANSLLKVLRALIRLALDLDLVGNDPSTGIKRLKSKNPDGHYTWSEPDIDRFEARWPKGSEQRLALALLLYTAQRRSDVVLLGPKNVAEDGDGVRRISLKQTKTGTAVQVPLHPDLDELLPHDRPTFLLTPRGLPYSADGFGHWFRKACDAAGLTHCSAHGLRKAAARRLAEAGCSTHEIAAITGHQAPSEVDRYTRKSERDQLADGGMSKLLRHHPAGGKNSF